MKTHRIFRTNGISFCLLIFWAMHQAYGQEPSNGGTSGPAEGEVATLGYEWFDQINHRVEINWPLASEWVESGGGQILKTWVQAQDNYVLDEGKESGAKVSKNVPGAPFPPAAGPIYLVELQPDAQEGVIVFRAKKNRRVTLTLHVKASAEGVSDNRPWKIGFGMDMNSYSEKPFAISTLQLGLAVRAEYKKSLTSKIDAVASLRGTLIPLSISQSTVPLARFWGGSLSGIYNLPWKWKSFSWSTGLGVTGWGMIVPENAYGVGTLVGPQWTLLGRQPGHLPTAQNLFLKIAFLGSGNEFRAGYEKRTDLFGPKKVWYWVAELGYTSYQSKTQGNSLTLLSGMVGLRFPFGTEVAPPREATPEPPKPEMGAPQVKDSSDAATAATADSASATGDASATTTEEEAARKGVLNHPKEQPKSVGTISN